VGAKREARGQRTNFQKTPGEEHSRSVFYIIYISIYFDGYIIKKSMQNVELVADKIR
jgi:hypothetical protein